MTPADQRKLLLVQAADAAAALGGVISLTCAALDHGWAVKALPSQPQITLPRNRPVPADRATGVTIRRLALRPGDIDGIRTSAERTVLDCARSLPFDAGLCVVDSALRHGMPHQRLVEVAACAKGPGSRRIRWVVHHATPLAANPFESVLRAIALSAGLHVVPQLRIGGADCFLGQPDLVDLELAIVLEADSFENHGTRAALRYDASRYNEFVVAGWLVLRFTWEDVMFRPEQVRRVILAAIEHQRTNRGR